jgi:electron transfer flavoprotein beta subunit
MRIVVILGRVLDPAGIVVNARRGRLFINREEYILHPADRCALEAALRIKDATGGGIVVLPRAPLADDDVLRQAMAIGADRAIMLVGPDELGKADASVMATVTAAAMGALGGADLLLTGAVTLDRGQSQLGPRVAALLDWPQVVNAWSVDAGDGTVQAVKRHETGYMIVETRLPAVVTVAPGALKLRYAKGARLISIYRSPDAVERWDVSDLVESSALTPVVQYQGRDFPPERELGVRVQGTSAEMGAAAAEALRTRV